VCKMHGNTGKLARIDLTNQKVERENTAPLFKQYLGGRAMNHILLFRDVDVAKVKALDPENEIIFSAGCLGGTTWPSSGRLQATFIAPLPYSGWGDSNIGGAVGPELKFAGWDALVIQGKAAEPTYLYIEDDKIEFRSAKDLWGKGVDETTHILHKRHMGSEVLLIGPAGENLSNFACIRTHRTSSAGRGGGGAVMGSKNLKGIVIKGSKGVHLKDPNKFLDLSLQRQKDLMDPDYGPVHSLTYKIMSKYGVPGVTRLIGQTGMTPRKNWNECGIWEDDVELTEMMGDKWWTRQDACYTCPVHCHGAYKLEDPEFGCFSGGPEYETTTALGHKCMEPRGKVVLKLNAMCNDLGFDTVSAGAVFSTLMEWYEKGIIDESFTDGVPMTWGNGEGMIELLPKMATREGCGDKLAKGAYWIGKELGDEAMKCIYQQKGMCATGVDTRSTIGSMLQFAVSPRGSHHLSGLPTAEWVNIPEVAVHITGFEESGDIRSYHPEGKAKLVQFYENLFELPDSLGICKFNFGHLGYWHDSAADMEKMWDYLSKAIEYATGTKFSKENLLEIGERAYQIERAVIALRGIKREDDMPNFKNLNEECPGDHPTGPVPLPPIDREKFELILDKYYELRGWDDQGIPTRECLEKLDLKEVADTLEKAKLFTAKGKKKK
jgi:aldehyde:ferredoxin oxidoreductase